MVISPERFFIIKYKVSIVNEIQKQLRTQDLVIT